MYALDFQAEQGERHCRERPHMDVRAGLVVEARIAQTASAAWKAEVAGFVPPAKPALPTSLWVAQCRSKNLPSAMCAKSKGANCMFYKRFDFACPELVEGLNTNAWINPTWVPVAGLTAAATGRISTPVFRVAAFVF